MTAYCGLLEKTKNATTNEHQGGTMATDLQDKLRALWSTDPVGMAPSRTKSTMTHDDERGFPEAEQAGRVVGAIGDLDAVRFGGVAVVVCGIHSPPFDVVEEPEPRRPDWIRSTCRLCGRFLGYRPMQNSVQTKSRS
ncbi:MAG: hypothetical protein ACK5PB_22315 [Pirellula sp.]|jgi:hypothetical protein